MYKKSIFWFRQDLRVSDNTGLYEAVENSQKVLPLFILDTYLTGSFGGLSDPKFGFLREALEQVSENLRKIGGKKVIVLHGKPEEIIPELVKKYKIECIFTNTSYGSYGKTRDEQVIKAVNNSNCKFESHKDFLIAEPQEIEQRKVFTPFYKLWQKYILAHPESTELLPKLTHFSQLETSEQTEAKDFINLEKHPYFTMQFGLKRLEKHINANYDNTRNSLDKDGTSRLSPYLRHGVFSVRQIYNRAQGVSQSYVSELAWREFWWHILYNFPNTREQEFLEKYRDIEWSRDEVLFEKWCKGETGYPIVDAAMRQLNETNWMHGRARMVVASFLTKDMHIDWRLGEKYFREKLLDYDEAVNLGNWQWSASVGADPKPLRIFSPMLQSEKFDPEARFIRKYIPELELESVKAIHNPLDTPLTYCEPTLDHKIETGKAREMYKVSFSKNT
ncbi:DNA photolyase family protein [Candidatus Gracilibacteria bacterium]|nr:DNA photolyase family protein [Candidatus Gracilibacteria bacterium]